MTKIQLCFAAAFMPLTVVFADITIHQTVKNPGKPPMEITKYISETKMRMDSKQGGTEIVSIVKDGGLERCTRIESRRDLSRCEQIQIKKENTGHKIAMVNFQNHKVTKLNKTGTFAGRKCQYFSRTLTTSMTMTVAQNATKHSEEFCVDSSVSTPSMATMDEGEVTNAFMSPEVKKKFMQEESKAIGLVLYSKMTLDDGQAEALRQMAGKMGKYAQFAKQASANDVTLTETTSIKEGKLPDDTFLFPKNMKLR